MTETEYVHILLATMGGQPQIVTFTLDLLLQRNIPISEVHIVHPATARIRRAVQILTNEFLGDRLEIAEMPQVHKENDDAKDIIAKNISA